MGPVPLAPSEADWLQLPVMADGLIAMSCFAILWLMLRLVRRRRPVSAQGQIVVLAAVMAVSGLNHALAVLSVWLPIDSVLGPAKAVTAAVALAAVLAMLQLMPKLLAMRTPEELAEANQRLREEVASREIAEDELRRSLFEMNRAAKELEQFAHIISHDLQAPLRTISGFSQLLVLRHRERLDGDALEFLDYIDKGARQMQQLIRDLLALSRVGRSDIANIERKPLAETLTRTIKGLKPVIDRTGAEIAFGTLPEIEANHGLLVQLLHNLIDNAIKFQKPGERPKIRIDIDRDGDFWALTITDNGIGIAEDQLESVFAIFRRLHGPEDYEGTGVGLAICRKIAEFHGGSIRATSTGSGTAFHLRLPVHVPGQRSPVAISA